MTLRQNSVNHYKTPRQAQIFMWRKFSLVKAIFMWRILFALQTMSGTNSMYAALGAGGHNWLDGQLSPLFNSGWLPQAPNPD